MPCDLCHLLRRRKKFRAGGGDCRNVRRVVGPTMQRLLDLIVRIIETQLRGGLVGLGLRSVQNLTSQCRHLLES